MAAYWTPKQSSSMYTRAMTDSNTDWTLSLLESQTRRCTPATGMSALS